MRIQILGLYRFGRDAIKRFIEHDGLTQASALAYQTLLSIVPLMVASLGLIGAFPAFKDTTAQFEALIFRHLVADSAEQIHQTIQSFAGHAANLSATGILFLVISAIIMLSTMETSLNEIWNVKQRRKGVNAFLIYWAALTLLPILGGTAIALSVYFFSLPYVSDTFNAINSWIPLLALLPLFLIWVAFSLLYATLPNCKVRLRHAMVGGLVAALLFEGGKSAFGVYAQSFSSYTFIYGALAAVPVLLVWIFLSWAIVLFGAVVAAQLGGRQHRS